MIRNAMFINKTKENYEIIVPRLGYDSNTGMSIT